MSLLTVKESIGHTLFCVVHARKSKHKNPGYETESLYITLGKDVVRSLNIHAGDSLDIRIVKHQKARPGPANNEDLI